MSVPRWRTNRFYAARAREGIFPTPEALAALESDAKWRQANQGKKAPHVSVKPIRSRYGLSAKSEAFYRRQAEHGLVPSPEAIAALRAVGA